MNLFSGFFLFNCRLCVKWMEERYFLNMATEVFIVTFYKLSKISFHLHFIYDRSIYYNLFLCSLAIFFSISILDTFLYVWLVGYLHIREKDISKFPCHHIIEQFAFAYIIILSSSNFILSSNIFYQKFDFRQIRNVN